MRKGQFLMKGLKAIGVSAFIFFTSRERRPPRDYLARPNPFPKKKGDWLRLSAIGATRVNTRMGKSRYSDKIKVIPS